MKTLYSLLFLAVFAHPLSAEFIPNDEVPNQLDLSSGYHGHLAPSGGYQWTKFIYTLDDKKAYYMNAREQKLHYKFARDKIKRFRDMSLKEFQKVTLHAQGREAISGGILLSQTHLGIDLVSKDPISTEETIEYLKVIAKTIKLPEYIKFAYSPAFNLREAAEKDKEAFKEAGFPIIDQLSLSHGTEVYSQGWAVGTLKYFEYDNIEEAYQNGELTTLDILVTNGIPSELPAVAGVISLFPATPNSHPVILAQSYGIPFIFSKRAGDLDLLEQNYGKELYLSTVSGFGQVDMAVAVSARSDERRYHYRTVKPGVKFEKEGEAAIQKVVAASLGIGVRPTLAPVSLDTTGKAEIEKLKTPKPLEFPVKRKYLGVGSPVERLTIKDAHFFGGKASNFHILRKTIPENSPSPAVGLSFDVFDRFMDGAFVGDVTLRRYVRSKLADYSFPVENPKELFESLDEVRETIKDARVPRRLKRGILRYLHRAGFDPKRKIRFRSSTNVEDGNQFSGAGLYDSFSGCLADDSDKDDLGPSHCDPKKKKERGAIRAIRKVIASFYNDNAFIERLRHKVEPAHVGMAILAHYSFPDEIELANGVMTYGVMKEGDAARIDIVSQVGATSVTNPDPKNVPEHLRVYYTKLHGSLGKDPFSVVKDSGMLSPGRRVMGDEKLYRELVGFANKAVLKFLEVHSLSGKPVKVDLEYKWVKEKTGPRITIKQVRRIPEVRKFSENPFVVGGTYQVCTSQSGSFKSMWPRLAETHIYKATGKLVLSGGYVKGTEHRDRLERFELQFYDRKVNATKTVALKYGDNEFELNGNLIKAKVDFFDSPFKVGRLFPEVLAASNLAYNSLGSTQTDVRVTFTSEGDFFGGLGNKATLLYYPCSANPSTDDLFTVEAKGTKGQTAKVEFNYTQDNVGKGERQIGRLRKITVTGFTKDPLVFQGSYSMSYSAGHHNFVESFWVEPALEEKLAPETLKDLHDQGIFHFYFSGNILGQPFEFYTLDEKGRATRISEKGEFKGFHK